MDIWTDIWMDILSVGKTKRFDWMDIWTDIFCIIFLICLYVWYKYRVVLLVFKLLQGVNDILGIIIYSPVF